MFSRYLLPALGAGLLCLASAASGVEPAAPSFGEYQAKGFLSDYANLAADADEDGVYRYRDDTVDVKKYNKLLVDRIKIWFKEDSDYKGIDPDELKMLTDYFYEAIETATKDSYPMVSEPGPDVLRLRIAVTDLVPNRPEASVTSLVVPFLWLGEAGAGAATKEMGSTPFTGEATIELEAMDSQSSKQIAAYIETRIGKKYNWTSGISEGVSSYVKAYSKWEYTKKAMDSWAQLIRQRLDEAHGKKPKTAD
jgi:hypothetical protein